MLKTKEYLKNNVIEIFIFLCVIFLYYTRISKSPWVFEFSYDEIGTFASAAKVAGLNWDSVVANARYYGFGFYWLYAIFFKIFHSPLTITYAIYMFTVVLLGIMAVVIYRFVVKEMNDTNKLVSALLVVLITTIYPQINYKYFTNDAPNFMVFWLFVICMEKVFVNREKKFEKWIAILLGYALTIHEKNVSMWIVFFAVFCVWKVIFKKKVFQTKIVWGYLFGGYFLARFLKRVIINSIWILRESNEQQLANTDAFYGVSTWFLEEREGIKVVFDIVVSNIISLNTYTLGLVNVAIIVMVILCKEAINKRNELEDDEKKVLLMFLISFFVLAVVIAGLGVTWGRGVWATMYIPGYPVGKNARAFSYLRYYYVFVGPLVLAVHTYFSKKRNIKILLWAVGLYIIQLVYYCVGMKKIRDVFGINIISFLNVSMETGMLLSIILFIAISFYLFFYNYRCGWIVGVGCIFLFIGMNFQLNKENLKKIILINPIELRPEMPKVDGTIAFFNGYPENRKLNIYVCENAANYQFALFDCEVKYVPLLRIDKSLYGLFLSNYSPNYYYEQYEQGYISSYLSECDCIQLDEDEYLYKLE